ncbi:GDP-mannose 4,6-dehydratase [Allocoleopsis sp.]|uniref:GDP-mannose 4,6-dehydratase n=1 Tax=Allocoleopsis sp. TaxID=3088169 RepID=UPI002FD3E1B1
MSEGQSTILVTGGAGYIGSHAVLALKSAGYEVIVLDNLSYGHRELVEQVLKVKLIVGDISDRALLDQLFTSHNISAVMHADLAQAHILGLEYLLKGGDNAAFNLGNSSGFSVRKVIETTQEVTGKPIKIVECDRRPCDPPVLVGSSDKARNVLGWHPQYPNLKEIVTHAWQWHQRRHGAYFSREVPELASEGIRETRETTEKKYFSS